MLIKNPPVAVSDKVLMLGTNAYPMFLYSGEDEGTLFEGGVGAMGPLLLEQFDQLGIRRDFVKQIVVTHAHPDHVMAVPLLRREFPGAQVLASGAAAKTMGIDKAIGFFCKIDGALTGSLLQSGAIDDRHRPEALTEMRIPVDRLLKEGDAVVVDTGVAFRVLETPGHSECSLSLFEPDTRTLVISDAAGYYLPEHDLWWPNYFTGYAPYVSSLVRLAKLGAEVLCLSHNGAIRGARAVARCFRDALAATKAYHERILAEAKAGKAPDQIAAELGAEIHARTPLLPLDFFQKNCAVLVKQSLAYGSPEQKG
ncbi:MAG TPA: MBL fold metallo-hydrolase [Planctomycetota bacterium]|nr:MBL fold metallo-hydrolase [Planctomycetota bacterium]HRR80900.1 MBL fold metallo-hydrolase [Planctomycetota bacterium]HRT93527.1 MBL fold metallo-hydrolase [Planctomycetota bacterium]